MDPSFTSLLCARGCGFYGTAENRGLCSKCFMDYLKENLTMPFPPEPLLKTDHYKLVDSLKSSRITEGGGDNNNIPTVSAAKNRCVMCKKKVGLLGFECRCGGTFCGMHRYPEKHSCNIDFKTAGRIALEKENPICRADKIKDRI